METPSPTEGSRRERKRVRMRRELLESARKRMKENTVVANSMEEVSQILRDATAEKGGGKFVMAHIKDDPACDARIKEFKASVRNVPESCTSAS